MSKRILVVDDNETIRFLIKEIIVLAMGYEVVLASNPKEAIKIIGEKHIDLVITDRNMPWMLGEELVRHIKFNCPEIKVIFVSSAMTPEIEKVALTAGADVVMDKSKFIHIETTKFTINKLLS